MNKLFIGLLIVAAGARAYFLLRKKNKPDKPAINKEMIIGKWTPVQPATDSTSVKQLYEFTKDGIVLRSYGDTTKTDTLFYEWNKNQELLWKENSRQSGSRNFAVTKLTEDSLQIQPKDSLPILFTRAK